MKKYWFILFFSFVFANFVAAQGSAIIKDINAPKQGQGSVTVYQDESIDGLLGSKITPSSSSSFDNRNDDGQEGEDTTAKPSSYIQTRGYKIQVFSGNDQKKSKNEASSRKRLIESSFPDTEVTITFNSPVWRARAGNYKSYDQAMEALRELKNAFPGFGREMQIVEAVVKIPVY